MTTDTRTTAAVKALRKIQLGAEVTPGTNVATTALWRGPGTMEDLFARVMPSEDIGIGPSVGRQYIPNYAARVNLAPIEETFEQGPYLFEMGAKKVGTGVADGGGTGKVYEYPFWYLTTNKRSQATLGTKTFQVGGENNVEVMDFGYAETITLEGKGGGGWMMSASCPGRKATNGVRISAATLAFVQSTKKITDSGTGLILFTTGMKIKVFGSTSNDGIYTIATGGVAAEIVTTEALVDENVGATITIMEWFDGAIAGLTVPSVEEVPFTGSKVYLDAVAGSLGTTQVSNTVLAAKFEFKTGIKGVLTGDGSLFFSHLEFTPVEITGSLTMLWNGSAYDEYANFKALTPRLIRVRSLGTALVTPDAYTYKTRDVEGAMIWETFEFGEQDGNEISTGNFRFVYNSTAAKFCTVRYVNVLASLT